MNLDAWPASQLLLVWIDIVWVIKFWRFNFLCKLQWTRYYNKFLGKVECRVCGRMNRMINDSSSILVLIVNYFDCSLFKKVSFVISAYKVSKLWNYIELDSNQIRIEFDLNWIWIESPDKTVTNSNLLHFVLFNVTTAAVSIVVATTTTAATIIMIDATTKIKQKFSHHQFCHHHHQIIVMLI